MNIFRNGPKPLEYDRSDLRAFVSIGGVSPSMKRVLLFGDTPMTDFEHLCKSFTTYRIKVSDYLRGLNEACMLIAKAVEEYASKNSTSNDMNELREHLLTIHENIDLKVLDGLKAPYGIELFLSPEPKFTYSTRIHSSDFKQELYIGRSDKGLIPDLLSEIRKTSFDEEKAMSPLIGSIQLEFINTLEESGDDQVIQSILQLVKVENFSRKYSLPEVMIDMDRIREDLDRYFKELFSGSDQISLEDYKTIPKKKKVFIVHGRNDDSKKKVKKLITDLGLEPIILHEQVSEGRTIFENFALHSDVGSAVVIYDGDDSCILTDDVKGKQVPKERLLKRPRPNVILEHGYLTAKLGRDRIVMLVSDPDIDLPTDILGVTYIPMSGNWRVQVKEELTAMNLSIKS